MIDKEIDKNNIKAEHFNGIYADLADLLGFEVVLKIHNEFRGQQINVPVRLFSKEFVVSQIMENNDGSNMKSLATRYGYSEKWVRQILKEHDAHKAIRPIK